MNPNELEEVDQWHEALLRVRYAETDKMGVVYHANYLIWFEIGRTEFCRARGFSYRDMEENENAFLVVAESYCRYKAPAYYDDVLIVRTHITELRRRSLRFGYELIRESDGVVIAEGETGHVVTTRTGACVRCRRALPKCCWPHRQRRRPQASRFQMISHRVNQAQPHCSWLKLIRSIDRARPVASSTSTIAPQMRTSLRE